MRFVRVILALMIALSVAMLPTVGSAASTVSATAQGASEVASMDMAMMSEMSAAMDDCCPDHARTNPCDSLGDRCPMAFCAAQPVSIASPTVFHFDFSILVGNPVPVLVDQVVSLHRGSPPFRPPRV